ncbi:hypothetical protein CBD41_05255 [bacterium TMED181]|nr:hypothetical protein [Planctomycetota bacterium]OUW44698.1 MAG: hypothetical protein CBD41_05255 [bacterium TMED181]
MSAVESNPPARAWRDWQSIHGVKTADLTGLPGSQYSSLEEENEQLELLVTMLMQRLQERNILSGEEIRSLAEIIDPPDENT